MLPAAPSSSAPFFQPTAEDTAQVATLTSELETMAMECAGLEACDEQMDYSRGLISLFENREAARASFQQVITLHPSSPLAAASGLWLQLLKHEEMASSSNELRRQILTELTAQWARDSARQLSLRPSSAKTTANLKPANVHALMKQVRERDQRIAELRAQLDALKLIDQEQQDRSKLRAPSVRVPTLERQR